MSQTTYMGYAIDPDAGLVYGKRGHPFLTPADRGYIDVHSGATGFNMRAHRMIWEAVHGTIPEGMQINHINGVKTDNRITNLELVTPSENTKHAYRVGLRSAKGEKKRASNWQAAAYRHAGTGRMTSAQRKYWDFVGSLPCQLCGAYGVQISHSNQRRGLGQKAQWWDVAALCPTCHNEIDNGSKLSQAERRALHDRAVCRTFASAIAGGILEVSK